MSKYEEALDKLNLIYSIISFPSVMKNDIEASIKTIKEAIKKAEKYDELEEENKALRFDSELIADLVEKLQEEIKCLKENR